ncbi:alcohol dehydrogenase catalytic domain-containing protein [Agromyces cerinus]|uniref:alcohol dehydrogenase n=1 Tax=Agromyces cerinus subsp. cerinus TaxID=232089 RepID=A0A1N6ESE1_9MICO|nr:alcohol dehydrogenase catalytic domain-containing protein [Agromyces cerinus]SIN85945.1 putative phosphonate catabolism associated alcohol dehydrogenase [Agromyces cerinus subsp. cerinus]
MHTVVRVGDLDVIVKPSPVAMVWYEPGRPHEALAAPGVRLAPGEALVEVELATVCGSDVHTVSGHRSAPAPLVLGHEQVGRVVAVGDGAVRADGTRLALGDRVVWSVTVSCGDCDRCRRGFTQKCRVLAKYGHERVHRGWELSGGFATHVQLRAGTATVRVSESLPAAIAAPASCATATAVAALDAAAAKVDLDGALVLVTGAGMIGLSVAAMAVEAGAEVVVADPDASRRAFARRLGAVTADPLARGTSPERLDSVLAGFAERGLPEVLVAIEASGTAAAVRTVLDVVGVGGVAVLVGSVSPGSEVSLDPETVVRRLATVTGVHNYTAGQLEQAVAFLERSWQSLPFDELVGVTHPLAELDLALEEAATGLHVRVGVAPGRRPI